MTETATTAAPARTLPNDSVVAVYDTPDKATKAIESLVKAGFPSDRVSVIGQSLQSEVQLNGFVTTGDVAKTGAAAGAWVGGLFGLLTGVAALFIPGVGPLLAVGPLASTLVGAAEGAVGAGVLSAMVGYFVSKKHIPKYTQYLTAGKSLVVVHGTPDDVRRAQEIMQQTGGTDLMQHNRADAN
ncbi:MAG: general stress protein [Candidatus Dormiibacterota bacterium]